ncbi:MAG: DUF4190 domain-containing protein, partial [Opitutaceae bacterium]|nr:DUF4190 domain-containing protein [Opitutaceae bacterium]
MATPPSLPNVLPPEQPAAPPRTSGLAITSLVLGILSLLGGALLLAPPVLAVVFGHISAANCKKDRSLSGAGLGIAGLVMGYVAFAVQFGLYVSPVGFLSTKVPEEWRLLYSVNPMVGVIDGFRWCLLGG